MSHAQPVPSPFLLLSWMVHGGDDHAPRCAGTAAVPLALLCYKPSCFFVLCCITLARYDVLCHAVLCCVPQPPARGGGLTIAPPREDKADSDRGFLEVINITLLNTRIEGNRAIEGGGVWSAWPMLVVNATVRNNTAEKAVSNADYIPYDSRDLIIPSGTWHRL
jgi:hypothetical protein